MVDDPARTGLARGYSCVGRSDGDEEHPVLLRDDDVIQGPLQRICAARGGIQGHCHELSHARESELRAAEGLPGAKGVEAKLSPEPLWSKKPQAGLGVQGRSSETAGGRVFQLPRP